MRLSRYNYSIKVKEGHLTYNSFSGKMILTNDKLENCVFSTEEKNKLYDWDFLINEKIDELDKAIYTRDEILYDNQLCITFIPSFGCPFCCPYCYQKKDKTVITYLDMNKLVLYVKKNISKFRRVHITFFGGEPLESYEQCFYLGEQVKDICQRQGKIFTSSLITNGYFLNSVMLNKLSKINCYDLQITLDGDEEFHDKYRLLKGGEKTFEIIYKNIKNNVDFLKRKHINLIIRINVSKENIKGISNLTNILNNDFKDCDNISIYYYPISNWGKNRLKGIFYDSNIETFLLDEFIKSEFKINYCINDFLPGGRICFGFHKNSYLVLPNLKITKCSVDFNKNICGYLDFKGDISLENYDKPYDSYLKEQCKKCHLIGTCYGLKCRNKDCDMSDEYSKLKKVMILLNKQNKIIDWRKKDVK